VLEPDREEEVMAHQLVAHVVHGPEPVGLADAAHAVAAGLSESMVVRQHPATSAPRLAATWLDLLVVGVPARVAPFVGGPSADEVLQPWLRRLGEGPHSEYVATFETRPRRALLPRGWSARVARRRLYRHGYIRPAGHRTFTVDRTGGLAPGERERARAWGRALARDMAAREEGRFVARPGVAV
jgi:hypothetical protein